MKVWDKIFCHHPKLILNAKSLKREERDFRD
jgi:hypothetical protein